MLKLLLIPGIVFGLIIELAFVMWGVVRAGWAPIADAYPAQPQESEGVCKRFQSFRCGWVSFGFSIHVEVDEKYLHLTPVEILQWVGAEKISIPWDAMTVKTNKRHSSVITVRLENGKELTGPRWCLQLADPPDEVGEASDADSRLGDDAAMVDE